jgi:demethylmenaquinone methyltransferase/2-methoxy-6-polyprenyl-1,4-benzoquinol methylase
MNTVNKVVKPYNEEEAKKSQITSMFDKIAPYYDFLNHFLSVGIDIRWRKRAIGMLNNAGKDMWLDIATGTADLALEAERQMKPKKIIGLDISNKMLELGKKKIEKKGKSEIISLEIGDSEHLRFEANSFDVVMASFGVRNFENLQKGLCEMCRVCKPAGKTMILEFSKPRVFPIKNLFSIYFKNLLPVIGKLKSKDPRAYSYLYESVQKFPDYEDFAVLLKEAGFSKVTYKPLTFGICTIYLAEK